jgi:hypothetical protein
MASNPIQMIEPEHVHSTTPLIAFGFSWLMFLPGSLIYYGVISLSDDVVRLLAIAGLFGPILSGSLLIAATRGRMGYREEVDTVFAKLLPCDDSGIEIAFAPLRLSAHNFSR